MGSDDSLPVLTDLEFDFPILTPSTLGQPIEPIVTFLSPPSITIPSNPASSTNNRTPSQLHREYLQFIQLLLLPLISCNLLPFLLLLETLYPRSNLPAKSEFDRNRTYAFCNVLPTKTVIAAIDSKLHDSTNEKFSLDSREL